MTHEIREGLKRVFAPLLLDKAPNTLSAHEDNEVKTIIETFLGAIDQEGLVLVRATDMEEQVDRNGVPLIHNRTRVFYTDSRTEKYVTMDTERLAQYDDHIKETLNRARIERVGGSLLKELLGIGQD